MFNLQKIPIGLYEKALPSTYSIKEKLEIARNSGYDFFEMSVDETDERLSRLEWDMTERNHLVEAMKETGIPILSMCLSGHRRFPMGSMDPEIRKKALDIMEKAICLAVDTGIRIIQLAGYDVYYEKASVETKEFFMEGLKASVSMAEKAGVILAIEIMDSEFINSVKKAMKYVKEIDSHCLQVYPDMGNMSAWGNSLEEDFEAGRGHIAAVHIKETKAGVYRDLSFGEGSVDFVKAFSKLCSMNFQGPFLIEMWAKSSGDQVEDVKNSLIWVKDKMRKGGYETC